MATDDNQHAHAELLAGLINEDHASEYDHLTAADILDYLAISGLSLTKDPTAAADAYYLDRAEDADR